MYLKIKLLLGIEFLKTVFVLKKTCLIELVKIVFRTNKTKNLFESYCFFFFL